MTYSFADLLAELRQACDELDEIVATGKADEPTRELARATRAMLDRYDADVVRRAIPRRSDERR